jgi:hypothetical protein
MKKKTKESKADTESNLSSFNKRFETKLKKTNLFEEISESPGKKAKNFNSQKVKISNVKKKILSSKVIDKKPPLKKATKKNSEVYPKSKVEITKKNIDLKPNKKVASHQTQQKKSQQQSTNYSSSKIQQEESEKTTSYKLILGKEESVVDKRQYHSEKEKKKKEINEYKLYKPKDKKKEKTSIKIIPEKKTTQNRKSIIRHNNSSVPINKNGGCENFVDKKLDKFNFNLSGYIETEKIINLNVPMKSRKEIFSFQEQYDNQRIIKYIKQFFKMENLEDFKTKIDFYDIEKMIGKGNFGKVYECTHKLTGEKVAIKCIEKTTVKNFKKMQKIFNEIDILSGIDHKNIIQLYEIFENPKFYFFVTEFAEKGDLFKMLKKSVCFNDSQIFLILKDVLAAMDYIHSKSILHRDIKLDNILINNEYQIKLCDFGVSCKTDLDEFNNLKEKCGTPVYLAPEIILGNYSGFASDVF